MVTVLGYSRWRTLAKYVVTLRSGRFGLLHNQFTCEARGKYKNVHYFIPSIVCGHDQRSVRNCSVPPILLHRKKGGSIQSCRSLCTVRKELDECHCGPEFRNIVYSKLQNPTVTPEEVAKSLSEFQEMIHSVITMRYSLYLFIKSQAGFPPENRVYADLHAAPEFESLLAYIAQHMSNFSPEDLVSVFCDLTLLGVSLEHQVMVEITVLLPDLELDIITIGKLATGFMLHPNNKLVATFMLMPKLQQVLERGDIFPKNLDSSKMLEGLMNIVYTFDKDKVSCSNIVLCKILHLITTEKLDLKQEPYNIDLCFKITYILKRYGPPEVDHRMAEEIIQQCMDQFSQIADNIDLRILSKICISLWKLQAHSFSYSNERSEIFRSLPETQILNRIEEILLQKTEVTFDEMQYLLPCVLLVRYKCNNDIWNKLRLSMEENVDKVTISSIREFSFFFQDHGLPVDVWQSFSKVCSVIICRFLSAMDPKLYSDISDDPVVFQNHCWTFLNSSDYSRSAFFRYVARNFFFRNFDSYFLDFMDFSFQISAFAQISVLDKEIPSRFYEKILAAIPAMNVKYLDYIIFAFEQTHYFTGSKQLKLQLFQIHVTIFETIMDKIERAEDIQQLLFIYKSLKYTNCLKTHRFAALERLHERIEGMCSDLSYTTFSSIVHQLLSENRTTYQPKLMEILINFCLDNHPIIEIKDYMTLIMVASSCSVNVKRQEEFCDLMLSLVDEIFDSLSMHQQVTLLWTLSIMQIFPTKYLKTVFSFDYLQKIDAYLSHEKKAPNFEEKMMELNRCVVLECPELKQTWFYEPLFDRKIPPVTRDLIMNQSQTQCHLMVEDILGGINFVRRNIRSHYLYDIDFECLLSVTDNTPVSYYDAQQKPHLANSIQRVAVNFLDANEYLLHSRKLRANYLMKRRHLDLLGYKVVEIPHFEWNSMAMSKEEYAREYLKEKIFG